MKQNCVRLTELRGRDIDSDAEPFRPQFASQWSCNVRSITPSSRAPTALSLWCSRGPSIIQDSARLYGSSSQFAEALPNDTLLRGNLLFPGSRESAKCRVKCKSPAQADGATVRLIRGCSCGPRGRCCSKRAARLTAIPDMSPSSWTSISPAWMPARTRPIRLVASWPPTIEHTRRRSQDRLINECETRPLLPAVLH